MTRESGYSIREIDLSSADSDYENDDDAIERRRLPCPVIRLECPGASCDICAAIGTKIMVTRPMERKRVLLVFDVQTWGLSFGPRCSAVPSAPIYVPVSGDKLFCLDEGRTDMLYVPPSPETTRYIPGTPCVWSWWPIGKPPFNRHRVTSHAVHPDGQTIFVSVKWPASKKKRRASPTAATFTIDTECLDWKRHGEWALPFTGRAYFDHELDSWVGLSGEDDPDTLVHIISCSVVSANADGQSHPPSVWKRSKERLFCEKKPTGATLVHMEGRGQFCLVQCLLDEEEEEELLPQPCRHTLWLTVFSLKYDMNGDLRKC